MTGMTEMRTESLTGWPLRWAVARAARRASMICGGRVVAINRRGECEYTPDLVPDQYQMLARRHGVAVSRVGPVFAATTVMAAHDRQVRATGDTEGLAVCRAIVAKYMGSVVAVPGVLVSGGGAR